MAVCCLRVKNKTKLMRNLLCHLMRQPSLPHRKNGIRGLPSWLSMCHMCTLSRIKGGEPMNVNMMQNRRLQQSQASSQPSKKRQDKTSDGTAHSRLAQDVESIIFHEKDGLIAMNKPPLLSVFGTGNSNKTEESAQTLRQMVENRIQVLEKDHHVEVVLSLKSFYSGVTLMCTDQAVKNRVQTIVSSAAAQKKTFMSYLAITLREPHCRHDEQMESSISRQYLHDRELSVVMPETSKSARKAGDMMLVTYRVKPLAVSPSTGASLVEVTLNKDKWEAVEVLMSHHYSPVLGDHIYSSRTHTLRGVPFPVTPHVAKPGTQRVPELVQRAMTQELDTPGHPPQSDAASLYLHRHQVTLEGFPSKGDPPLTLRATPPSQFLTMLDCLGFHDIDERLVCLEGVGDVLQK